jgi:hypothetical protein
VRSFVQFGSCSLARLLGGLSLIFATHGAAQGCDATLAFSSSNSLSSCAPALSMGLLVDWNQDFIIYADLNPMNSDRSSMPQLLPDDCAPSTQEAASGESMTDNDAEQSAAENTPPDTSEGLAAGDNSNSESFSDYYKYKFSRYGECYGDKAGQPSQAAHTEEKPATPPVDDSAESMESMSDEGPSNASDNDKPEGASSSDTAESASGDEGDNQPGTSGDEYLKYRYGYPGAHYGNDSGVNPNPPQAADGSVTPEEKGKTDDAPKSDVNSESAAPADATNDPAPAADNGSSSTLEDYHRYRDQPIESRYGDNKDAASSETQEQSQESSDDSSDDQNSDGDQAMSDDAASGGTVARLGDALWAMISQSANDLIAGYGMTASQILNALPRM